MRIRPHRMTLPAALLALVAAACTGQAGTTTTTASTLPSDLDDSTTTSTAPLTTTTTEPLPGPPLISEGDRNEVVAAFQWLLTCNGFATLAIDGVYGPATGAAITASGGTADREALASLSRSCMRPRPLSGETPITVAGYAAPGTPAAFEMEVALGSRLSIALTADVPVAVGVVDAGGSIVEPQDDGTWPIQTTMIYAIRVEADTDPGVVTLDVDVVDGALTTAPWLITTNAISHGGTRLTLGDPADTVIEQIYELLGHAPRGNLDEFDTGWGAPAQPGFRGILIEGFRFLFSGPTDEFLDRPEILIRIRVVEPTVDADGEPRPFGYVTTPEGVGVGHTLHDLTTVYGTFVRAGSNADEHFYRLVNPRGELCFYFGATVPTPSSPIVEISTECRS